MSEVSPDARHDPDPLSRVAELAALASATGFARVTGPAALTAADEFARAA